MLTEASPDGPDGKVLRASHVEAEQVEIDPLNVLQASWVDRALAAGGDKRTVRNHYEALRILELPLELPTLNDAQREMLLVEAVHDTWNRYGIPLTNAAEEGFSFRVDLCFARLVLQRRIALMPWADQALLITRRIARVLGWSEHG